MSNFDPKLVQQIVENVMAELEAKGKISPVSANPARQMGVFERMEDAIEATIAAQKIWAKKCNKTRGRVIAALRKAMHDHADTFARMALEETGMGRFEDKVAKHHNAADATPGLEDLEASCWTGDRGLVVEEYAPFGVVAAITPSTHPIPVLLNSIIIITAPGNGAVFNVHPAAQKVSAYAMDIFNRAIVENGGPENLVSMVRVPTLESVNTLFNDPRLPLIVATGGPGLVKAAFAAGKKVIAAGPGNPPVLVDETADIKIAVKHIVDSASFDNNILCIAEKEVFVVESVFDRFMEEMANYGCIRLDQQQIARLTEAVFSKNQKGHWVISRDFIGKNASVLGRAVGLTLSDDVRMLYGETAADHLFVQEEQMMPFLPVVRVKDAEEGIRLSVQAEHGFQHTASIFSNNLDTITKFTKAIDTDIVVVNGPTLGGNGGMAGEAYFSHTIASPTGEGVCRPRDFARVRRMAIYGALKQV